MQPNIVLILADDLGYGELGAYGQNKIQTPHIDALAREGLLLTDYYAGSPVCAPSRYTLLTGKHTGHAFIRGNDEWGSRGDVWSYPAMLADPGLEGQLPIPDSTLLLSEILSASGYTCAAFGKWGLGAPGSEGQPLRQGFQQFYGYNCQRWAHTYYPPFLWKNDARITLNNPLLMPVLPWNTAWDASDVKVYESYAGREYAPESMLSEAKGFIKTQGSKPFFLFYPTPLPHAALQAPRHWVDYYHDKIGEEKPYIGEKGYVPVRYPRATYAAMISYLDEQVGALVATLKEEGLLENTLIFFTSDNGPTFAGGVDAAYFRSAGHFSVAADRIKGSVHEGGLRVPFIAYWKGKIKPGRVSSRPAYAPDLFPTLCELTGNPVPEGIDGLSMLPLLRSKGQQPNHPWLYWEFPEYGGQQAIRQGDWKLLRRDLHKGQGPARLFRLSEDPGEEKDLADQFPEKVRALTQIMRTQHRTSDNPKFQMMGVGDSNPLQTNWPQP